MPEKVRKNERREGDRRVGSQDKRIVPKNRRVLKKRRIVDADPTFERRD